MQYTDIKTLDHRVKWALVVVSLLTVGLLAASALKENIFAEWRTHRLEYAKILQAKATDDRGKAIAAQFEIGIDHNVLPELRAIDRCITCHTGLDDPRMIDEHQPFRTHPGNLLSNHPPERFGCTLCHQGQGRATQSEEAHGHDEDWLFPMFEKRFLYSACGKCHDEQALYGPDSLLTEKQEGEPQQGALLMAEGRQLLKEKGCLACHIRNGFGGTIGPDISFVGDKTKHEFDFSHFEADEPRDVPYWLENHFLDPSRISPETTMPDLELTNEDASALTAYVLSFKQSNVPLSYRTRPTPPTAPQITTASQTSSTPGSQLYMELCAPCHGKDGEIGEISGIRTPTLNNPDALAIADDDFYRFIIAEGRSGTAMPPWGPQAQLLSKEQIDQIVAHLRTWEAPGPNINNISARNGNPELGRTYYNGLCANCHGSNGQGGIGNTLNSPTFLAIASDKFLAETIVHGRQGTAMASWKHLSQDAVSDILAFLRSWQKPAPTFNDVQQSIQDSDPEKNIANGRQLFIGRCTGCHGKNAEGGLAPRLDTPDLLRVVDDKFLYDSIVKGRPETAMPSWNALSAEQVGSLIAYLRSLQDGPAYNLTKAPNRGDYEIGEIYYKSSCLPCHGEQGQGGVGPRIASPQFLRTTSPDVLHHWIAKGRAGTAMKGFQANEQGITQLADTQIADIIAYLRHTASQGNTPIKRTGVGNAFLGKELFDGNCVSCHGTRGQGASGPQLNNETFLKTASDGFLQATIILGREGTAMRSMTHGLQGLGQITPMQVQDVIAYMRLWDYNKSWRAPRTVAEMSERAIGMGEQLFTSFCAGCHGPNGKGIQDGIDHFAPALNNPEFLHAASDGFLLATIARGRSNTPMRPFGKGTGGIASLTQENLFDIVSYIRTWEEQFPAKGE